MYVCAYHSIFFLKKKKDDLKRKAMDLPNQEASDQLHV